MILGLDISTACTGWAILDKETKEVFSCGAIDFSKKNTFQEKVATLYEGLLFIFTMTEIDTVGIEDQFFSRNVDTIKKLARFSGVACTVANMFKSKVVFLVPTSVKKTFTGDGHADKEKTRARVLELYHMDFTNDNITDAISIAYVLSTKE